jgi:hypothetical protein
VTRLCLGLPAQLPSMTIELKWPEAYPMRCWDFLQAYSSILDL